MVRRKRGKRKVSRSVNRRAARTDNNKNVMKDFFMGMVLFVIIQAIFMIGGLYLENLWNMPVTGIPSVIGLLIVLALGIYSSHRKREYIFLGSFILSFLAPLILFLVALFNIMPVTAPHIFFSISMSVIIVLAVWIYFIVKILKNKF